MEAPAAAAAAAAVKDKWAQEYRRIALRFSVTTEELSQLLGSADGVATAPRDFRATVGVRHDNLPAGLTSLALHVHVPTEAEAPPSFRVVDASTRLPGPLISALEKVIASQFSRPGSSPYVALKWLDNHAGETIAQLIELQAEAHRSAAPPAAGAAPREDERHTPTVESHPPGSTTSLPVPSTPESEGSDAAAAAPADPWRTLFSELWTPRSHDDWQAAVREQSRRPEGLDISLVATWRAVAASCGKTPEECLARFLVLRNVSERWYQSQRQPIAAAWGEHMEAEKAAAAAATAAASAAALSSANSTKGSSASSSKAPMTSDGAAAASSPMQPDGTVDDRSGGSESEEEYTHEDEDDYIPEEEEEEASSDGSEAHSDAEHTHAHGADEDEPFLPAFSGLYLRASHSGTTLGFEAMNAHGFGALAVSRLCANIRCERCATPVTVTMRGVTLPGSSAAAASSSPALLTVGMLPASLLPDPDRADKACEFRGWCSKCSLLMSTYFRPVLMFDGEGGESLGYVDTTHAEVTSLSDVSLFGTCLDCGSVAEIPKFVPPATVEVACRTCFARLRFSAKACRVEVATMANAGAGAGAVGGTGARRPKLQRFVVGKPLPLTGTCKHYKHSYRWLRFPCCGVAYPCDTCHDERSDHPAERASRMLCGHCSREQPWSNAGCVGCGGRMGRGTGPPPRFWEGGQGQRNKGLLDKRDSHKFSGINKTKSKKSERVGSFAKDSAAAADRAATKKASSAGNTSEG